MKSRCGKTISQEEINLLGLPPTQAIEKLVPSINLIAFGESHWFKNPQRKLLMESIGMLAKAGFTTLALELEIKYQEVIDQFIANKIGLEDLQSHLLAAADSIFDSEERPCPYYFGAIDNARKCDMEIVVIDKNRDDHLWNHRDFAKCSRDSFMAQRINAICDDQSETKRVVFFGGNNHLYKRPEKLEDLTMIEWLSLFGLKTTSIAGILCSDMKVAGLTFERLYPLTRSLGEAKFLKTDCPGMDMFLGWERRCAWGGCNSETEDSCPGIEYNLCQTIKEDEIYSDYWDYVVFYDSDWKKRDCKLI